MLINILLTAALLGLAIWMIVLNRELIKLRYQQVNMALKVKEVDDIISRVDDSTGRAIHDLQEQFREFNTAYGEAAIEEKRAAAKAEKAWADGVNNIMNYSPGLHGRGEIK